MPPRSRGSLLHSRRGFARKPNETGFSEFLAAEGAHCRIKSCMTSGKAYLPGQLVELSSYINVSSAPDLDTIFYFVFHKLYFIFTCIPARGITSIPVPSALSSTTILTYSIPSSMPHHTNPSSTISNGSEYVQLTLLISPRPTII
jgi:hypothetical protein